MPNHPVKRGTATDAAAGASDSLAPLLAELQASVEQTRGHKALGLAKLLRKHPEYGPKHVPLVARAYEARLAEMHATAQHKAAQELLQMLGAQQPEVAAQISNRPALLVELGGGPGRLLARYGQDAGLTEEIDIWIRRDCRDPRPLAHHPHLPETHPLKVAAIAVLNAWEEVEHGAIAGAYARLPDAVGRRSPFVSWRLFVQALQAAYSGRDTEAAACLNRIEADCAVRPLADILRRILACEPPQNTRERILHTKIVAPSLHGSLSQIDRHLAAGQLTESQPLFDELVRQPIWAGQEQLFGEIVARYLLAIAPLLDPRCAAHGARKTAHAIYQSFQRIPRFMPSMAKFLCWDNADCAEDWEAVIRTDQPPPLAMAMIYDRLATIRLTREEDDLDDDAFDDAFEIEDDDPDADIDTCRQAEELWQQSVQFHPLRETFVHWHAATQRSKGDEEAALDAWTRAFPEDVTPLLALTALYRANRTPQKALAMFKRLESVARGQPEVEALRPLLRLDSAAGRLARGMHAAAEKDLDEIASNAPEFIRVACATLRWTCALRSGGDATASRTAWEAAEHPLWAFQTESVLASQWRMEVAAELAEVEARVATQARAAPAQLVADYARLAALPDAVWSLKRRFPCGPVIVAACRDRTVDSAALWDLQRGLFHPSYLSKLEARALFWALTGNGLARRDARTPEYLAYRALLYDPLPMPPDERPDFDATIDRAEECLAVAQRLAHASGRMEAVQTVEATSHLCRFPMNLNRLEARLTEMTCASVIDREAAIGAWADVPARLKETTRQHRGLEDAFDVFSRRRRTPQSRVSPPSTGPDATQPELW